MWGRRRERDPTSPSQSPGSPRSLPIVRSPARCCPGARSAPHRPVKRSTVSLSVHLLLTFRLKVKPHLSVSSCGGVGVQVQKSWNRKKLVCFWKLIKTNRTSEQERRGWFTIWISGNDDAFRERLLLLLFLLCPLRFKGAVLIRPEGAKQTKYKYK